MGWHDLPKPKNIGDEELESMKRLGKEQALGTVMGWTLLGDRMMYTFSSGAVVEGGKRERLK